MKKGRGENTGKDEETVINIQVELEFPKAELEEAVNNAMTRLKDTNISLDDKNVVLARGLKLVVSAKTQELATLITDALVERYKIID